MRHENPELKGSLVRVQRGLQSPLSTLPPFPSPAAPVSDDALRSDFFGPSKDAQIAAGELGHPETDRTSGDSLQSEVLSDLIIRLQIDA